MTSRTHADLVGRRHPCFVGILVIVTVLLAASAADAALTTPKCLVLKRKAWIAFRKCEGAEDVRRLRGNPANAASCRTKFEAVLAKIDGKAAKAAVACRHGDNGNGTVTDYDTGLMWEKKTGVVGGLCFVVLNGVDHCVNDTYVLDDARDFANPQSSDGRNLDGCFAGHCDWRLPNVVELNGIVDLSVPGCQAGAPCIDPILGSTAADYYWSSTRKAGVADRAWDPTFADGAVGFGLENLSLYVRVVRTAL